jgi:hypothetical protein
MKSYKKELEQVLVYLIAEDYGKAKRLFNRVISAKAREFFEEVGADTPK